MGSADWSSSSGAASAVRGENVSRKGLRVAVGGFGFRGSAIFGLEVWWGSMRKGIMILFGAKLLIVTPELVSDK